jgi:hypothetical protein
LRETDAFEGKDKPAVLAERVERGEENAASGVEQSQSRAAVDRIRARARNLKTGGFDWDAFKADRDAGRP